VDVAGCEAVLALADIQETWHAYEPESDDGYRRSYRGYRRWEGGEGGECGAAADAEGDDARYQLNDLIDSSIQLTRWTDPAGTSAEDISLVVAEAEVCTATPSSDLRPYTSEYEGYMGNYGDTLDRWYRRAAVVVWPRDRSFYNRAEASPSWAMDDLSARARAGDPAPARTAAATLAPLLGCCRPQPGAARASARQGAPGRRRRGRRGGRLDAPAPVHGRAPEPSPHGTPAGADWVLRRALDGGVAASLVRQPAGLGVRPRPHPAAVAHLPACLV
jgi:hypothetical protein